MQDEIIKEDLSVNAMLKETHQNAKRLRTYGEKNRRFLCKVGETIKAVEESLREYVGVLESVKKTNETVEETLLNVLLAIRQNEYLQAWYPAQNGRPEQKVVGKYVEA